MKFYVRIPNETQVSQLAKTLFHSNSVALLHKKLPKHSHKIYKKALYKCLIYGKILSSFVWILYKQFWINVHKCSDCTGYFAFSAWKHLKHKSRAISSPSNLYFIVSITRYILWSSSRLGPSTKIKGWIGKFLAEAFSFIWFNNISMSDVVCKLFFYRYTYIINNNTYKNIPLLVL